MEQIVNLIVCFLMISTIDRVHSYPAPSDILSGQEFLSLLMEPEVRSSRSSYKSTEIPRPSTPTDLYRGSRKFYYGRAADEESVLPIEALFSSQEDLSRSSSRGYGYRSKYRPRSGKLLSSTSTTTEAAAEEQRDLEVAASEISVSSRETTAKGKEVEGTTATVQFSQETDATYSSTVTSTISTTLSTSQRSWLNSRRKITSTTKSSKSVASENERSVDSNSYRSELTIEESAPSIGTEEKDARGESSNIHRVITPFSQPVRGRMQRKQDSATPLQTVIYHDKKNEKDQPRSVSYSFRGETAPTLKTWKDIDEEYLPKQNESDNKAAETVDSPTTVQVMLEPAKIWSEPEKNYSEPAKVWSEPAKVYSEPARIYSEPAKIYSEPARIYSEPAKIYSRPSSYWQTLYDNPKPDTAKSTPTSTPSPSDEPKRLVFNELDKIPYDELNAPAESDDPGSIHNAIGKFVPKQTHEPPKRQHHKPTPDPTEIIDPYVEKQGAGNGNTATVVQTLAPVAGSPEDSKVGYVVDGRNYRKYRVEEKTPDGFIVGEYGVLSHNDGNLRGVRYTADSDINPRLIYDALLKFLSL